MNNRSRAKIKAVNLKFACKMSKFERTVFFIMANRGYLKRHPLKQGELNIFCKEMLCENADTDK